MQKSESVLDKFEALLAKFVGIMAASLFIFAVLFYTVQVTLRVFFQSTLIWIDPLIGYLFAISSLWGAALACQYNENIKIEIFQRFKQHPRTTLIANLLVDGFSLFITVVVIVIFGLHFRSVGHAGSTLSPEQWQDIPYILIFISSLLFYGIRMIRALRERNLPQTKESPSS